MTMSIVLLILHDLNITMIPNCQGMRYEASCKIYTIQRIGAIVTESPAALMSSVGVRVGFSTRCQVASMSFIADK